MNSNYLEQLRNCCRDQAAFEQMQQILSIASCSLQLERQKAVFHVISKIREPMDLETIFKTTATEVRQLLNVDRVAVFQLDPDSHGDDGKFVSEAVLPGFNSALHAKVHDHCFGQQYAVHYQSGKVQAVADIHNAGLQDCHIAILSQFHIKANLVVPLLQGKHLWGLLCLHQCAKTRQWQADEIDFVQQIAAQLSIAIQQAELLEKTQRQSVELAQALEELQRSHTHLIQSEKMSSLGQLVAGIAHEINNPVNFIYGNLAHANQYAKDLLELLSLYQQEHRQPSPDLQERVVDLDLDFLVEDFPKILSSMQMGANRIRQIVLSLRNFSRLDESEMKPVNIHDGIDSTLLILQHRMKPRSNFGGIQVVKEYSELPLVECYASQLNQVFMNIISNAIDALEELQEQNSCLSSDKPITEQLTEQQITISTGLLSDTGDGIPQVFVRIRDNGAGVPAQVQAKLFDPFFTTKPIGKGTGLGLSISHQIIVEKHGGTLECHSQPHQGTEFCIIIPIRQVPPMPETPLSYSIEP